MLERVKRITYRENLSKTTQIYPKNKSSAINSNNNYFTEAVRDGFHTYSKYSMDTQ